VIRTAWSRLLGFLGSATLALWLLVFVGVWSMAATAVPQGATSAAAATAWAEKHPSLELMVRAVGLHHAFTSPLFILCSVLLALSTAVCCWNRTKFALRRSRRLKDAASMGEAALAEKHDLTIEIASNREADALEIASGTLAGIGIKTARRGNTLLAVSPSWSTWGSPVFHWSLLLLIVAALSGALLRSEGAMALYVGQTKPDAPASYMAVNTGPLHSWNLVHRSIRVDAFEPNLVLGGIDRGAVPTVSVLDRSGRALVTQQVYPNKKLHAGSLSINAPECGLAVAYSILSTSGVEVARQVQLAAFSQAATDGTVPLSELVSRSGPGGSQMKLSVTVPLDRANGNFGEWIPAQPKARVVVRSAGDSVLQDRVVTPGQPLALPGGGSIRLDGIGWYSRLALTDDPTIPLVYASMVLAALGLTLTLVARQQIVAATVVQESDGLKLVLQLRLWRNVPTDRGEIERELVRALGRDEKVSES
jgi:hypothetical protein